ncbi:MAG: ectoine/hydroxyectoine ABC transporter substrate-binding protein EhuB [Rhodospirillaceae bacterium]|nr:ectoine/hydroxyectoine ABC transporter substrate-binding protein EhuB [Rhodospirillaceae bacterium]MCA8930888.1 ectoine/hydroxyectoine ABC transporter substrate-binding protein EhuB [Rhodospirillaceae bacterium]
MRTISLSIAAIAVTALSTTAAFADSITDRVAAGEPIRIGFANEVPWAYPGEDNAPLGFVNAFALGVLDHMGIDNIEPVVTEWGGLIPGLQAGRFDIITGGMYILGTRCENVNFAEPMGIFGDAFIVPAGNPDGIETFEDLVENEDAIFVTGAGYNQVEYALSVGVPDDRILQVPGPTEILAAVRAGRANAGGVTYFTALNLAEQSGGEVEVTDPTLMPEETMYWVGIAFRQSDTDFLAEWNAAQAEYLGSEAMMEAVAEYGYTESQLPGDTTTEYACANR